MNPARVRREAVRMLTDLPNVGPATAGEALFHLGCLDPGTLGPAPALGVGQGLAGWQEAGVQGQGPLQVGLGGLAVAIKEGQIAEEKEDLRVGGPHGAGLGQFTSGLGIIAGFVA